MNVFNRYNQVYFSVVVCNDETNVKETSSLRLVEPTFQGRTPREYSHVSSGLGRRTDPTFLGDVLPWDHTDRSVATDSRKVYHRGVPTNS